MATTTQIDTQVKLGKLPVRTDVRTLRLARYVDRAKLPPPPPDLDLAAAVLHWPMYANDRVGDCTTAAAAHMIEAWTAPVRGEAVEVSERAVLAAFAKVKQVDPRTGEEGAVELEHLEAVRGDDRHLVLGVPVVRNPQRLDEPDNRFTALGARGIGEIGITGIGGALCNAVYHATGRRIRDLPIMLDKVV